MKKVVQYGKKRLLEYIERKLNKKEISQEAKEEVPLNAFGERYDCIAKITDNYIDIQNRNNIVRISRRHYHYAFDIMESFAVYFNSVKNCSEAGINYVDFSVSRYHEVIGFEDFPICFPSFSESLETTQHYIDFFDLSEGSIVLDLGGYSGLTSIVLDKLVGKTGRVIVCECDTSNIKCLKKNLLLYKKMYGREITLLEKAIWDTETELMFSSEGNMGSSASIYLHEFRGDKTCIATVTLDSIMKEYNLERIDCIKCDIEGAENRIFTGEIFKRAGAKPKIIIEPHIINGGSTEPVCIEQLAKFGYTCEVIPQIGATLPLILATPPKHS